MGGMMGSLLLLLWAGVSVSTMVDLQKRIINGQDCDDDERQYHVQLIMTSEKGRGFCGGSLISPQWILTAAHCWEPGWTIEAVLRVHPHGNEITETIKKKNIKVFEGKDDREHDIMLLKLDKPRPGFRTINLPDCKKNPTPKNVMVQIAGHGATTAAGGTRTSDRVPHLQCAYVNANECPTMISTAPYDQVFCGSSSANSIQVDSCSGDSGGGVVYDDMIYGVIVTGSIKACVTPIEFTGVCGHMEWIKEITSKGFFGKPKDCLLCG